jgi:hypothetical protein
MEVWAPSQALAAALVGKDHSGPVRPYCRFGVEALKDSKDEPADLREKPAVVPEIGSPEFRESEDELPMGPGQHEPLVHVLREQKGSFQGRADKERCTAEWAEVLVLALRIGSLDAGDALGIVGAENELLQEKPTR